MSRIESIKKTILAVDDSQIMQGIVKQFLGQEYRVLIASNAIDALSIIYNEQVAVLLLDVSLPGINGLELCRIVRSIPQFESA